jgi:NADPH-dependent curcumin reductase CurA
MMMKTRQIQLKYRPKHISEECFHLVDVELPELKSKQVLIKNLYMSVDPYMRLSMEDGADLDAWKLDSALDGPSIGIVVDSKNKKFKEGDIVESMSAWQEHFISEGDEFIPYVSSNTAIKKRIVPNGLNAKDYLGLLGISSQCGYFAVNNATVVNKGETFVVSSGAGNVGMMASQVAKIKGMRVVSSTGSNHKAEWLKDNLGIDYVFNYKEQSYEEALKKGCPDGIDLVLECASANHMSACMPLMNIGKTILLTGLIDIYDNGGKVKDFQNLEFLLYSYLTLKSHVFMDYLDYYDNFIKDVTSWYLSGKLIYKEEIVEGIENAPNALVSLFEGKSHGKVLVSI